MKTTVVVTQADAQRDIRGLTVTSLGDGDVAIETYGLERVVIYANEVAALCMALTGMSAARQPDLGWVLQAQSMVRDKPMGAADIIYNNFDTLFQRGDWAGADRALQAFDLAKCPTGILLGLLTATLHVAEKLPSRPGVYTAIKQRFINEHGEARTERLLWGLEGK